MGSRDEPDTSGGVLGSASLGQVTGTSLALVHGFTQNSQSWRPIANALAHSHHVTTIDLPGHGRSTNIVVANLIDTARLVGNTGGRATYIGYSLGGRVCLALACVRPDLVERLVLISASPGISDPTERRRRAKADDALADRLDPPFVGTPAVAMEDFLDEWLAGPLFAHLNEDQADRSSRLENSTQGLAASLRSAGVGRQQPLHDQLATLTMPVICAAGEDDPRYVNEARAMALAIGDNAVLKIVARSGHAVPFEQPAATLALLERFCSTPVG